MFSSFIFPSKKLTSDGDRVSIIGFLNSKAEDFYPSELAKVSLMSLEMRTCEDYWRSDIIICDLDRVTIQHVLKVTLPFLKHLEVLVLVSIEKVT